MLSKTESKQHVHCMQVVDFNLCSELIKFILKNLHITYTHIILLIYISYRKFKLNY